jgi:ABC-type phosphonate transport system ATPase subunit
MDVRLLKPEDYVVISHRKSDGGRVDISANAGLGETLMRRWLGVIHRVGGLMSD